ncbi:MAG: hypothetical protein VYB15_12700 [Planctomycetota bacterium]|nr:hypothetical protein [Planctomycetota bacterium]MEE3295765.1 hypothetical protein [Planctomycetota bacterium]
MIESWASFWGWVLGASLVIFAGISVVVTIGGFRDIRTLLKQTGGSDDDEREGEGE